MEPTEQTGWENRLEELIDGHIRNLKNDFRSLLDEIAAPEPPDPRPPADLQGTLVRLKNSVETLLASGSQREMASHLLDAVSLQASRAALLLVRGKSLCGFEERGFAAQVGNMKSFEVEPPDNDPLARARLVTQHLPGEALAGTCLADWHDGEWPAQVCLAPIYVDTRTVAVVYADSGNLDEPGRIHPEAVEILASMAGIFLDRLRHAARATAEIEPRSSVAASAEIAEDFEPPQSQESTTPAADQGPASFDHHDHHDYNDRAATATPDSPTLDTQDFDDRHVPRPMALTSTFGETTQPEWQTDTHDEADDTSVGGSDDDSDPEIDGTPASIPLATFDTPAPPTAVVDDGAMVSGAAGGSLRAIATEETPVARATPPALKPTSSTVAPAPSTAAATPPAVDAAAVASDLPSNPDAERFARLLVSEIVLYNDAAVTRGKKDRDLYVRLQDSIDRSREVYVDRFSKELLVLFEAELVRTLADGDRALMGSSYA